VFALFVCRAQFLLWDIKGEQLYNFTCMTSCYLSSFLIPSNQTLVSRLPVAKGKSLQSAVRHSVTVALRILNSIILYTVQINDLYNTLHVLAMLFWSTQQICLRDRIKVRYYDNYFWLRTAGYVIGSSEHHTPPANMCLKFVKLVHVCKGHRYRRTVYCRY
jgi:hypothetical protein